jgi:acyl-CoA dehydrogenase
VDFSLTDEQRALTELAARILKDFSPLERLKAVEQGEDGFDRALWAELAKAGLLGAPLPEAHGGSGGGFLELCLLLEEQGRRAAMLPLGATLAGAALPLARFGTPAQRERWLGAVVRGEAVSPRR